MMRICTVPLKEEKKTTFRRFQIRSVVCKRTLIEVIKSVLSKG